jgi:16S rRNA G1207 methylase RsmC
LEHYFTKEPKSPLKLGIVKSNLRDINFRFFTASGIFSHKRIDPGTRLLIETMILPEKGTFLDLGCGYGPIGIVAARLRPKSQVYMTEINKRARELTEKNVSMNDIKNVIVKEGSLYGPVSDILFNVILTNPPITAGVKKTITPIICGAAKHLMIDGSLQLVTRTRKGGGSIIKLIETSFNHWKVIARRGGYRVIKAEL